MFSSTFQGKFNFQGLFKTVMYIQVLFKPVRTLKYMNYLFPCNEDFNVIMQHRSKWRHHAQNDPATEQYIIKLVIKSILKAKSNFTL